MNTIPISRDAVEQALLPCPFCGAGTSQVHENGKQWLGMRYSEPSSVSIQHWCEPTPGQPSRMLERVGKDMPSAIAAWNARATLAQADQPAQCWKCGDMDKAGQSRCTAPACGMKEADQPAVPHPVQVGTIGHVSCGNTTLTGAIAPLLADALAAQPEPQAQAGGPEILTSDDITLIAGQVTLARKEDGNDPSFVYAFARALEQRVLQSHREAIAKKDAEAAALRAALVGCVEALTEAKGNINPERGFADELEAQIDAAITQAQEQLK